MLHGAEAVGNARLAAVADEQHVDVAQRLAAMRAPLHPMLDRRGLGECAGVPVRALDRPRHDVLEAAEDGASLAGRLVGAETVIGLDA